MVLWFINYKHFLINDLNEYWPGKSAACSVKTQIAARIVEECCRRSEMAWERHSPYDGIQYRHKPTWSIRNIPGTLYLLFKEHVDGVEVNSKQTRLWNFQTFLQLIGLPVKSWCIFSVMEANTIDNMILQCYSVQPDGAAVHRQRYPVNKQRLAIMSLVFCMCIVFFCEFSYRSRTLTGNRELT